MNLGKLMGLKMDKSPGPDNLHPRVLKEVALEIVDPLVFGIVPTDWKAVV